MKIMNQVINKIKNIENLYVRLAFYVGGMIVMAFGISTTYLAAKRGTGAFDALNFGMAKTIGLNTGYWILINGILLVLLTAVIEKKLPKILCVIPVMIIGHFVNYWDALLSPLATNDLAWQIAFLAIGLLIISFGAAAYLSANMAPSPVDLITLTLAKQANKSFGLMKTVTEASFFLLAILFSGSIGIGTVVITLLIGPIIQMFLRPLQKITRTNEKQGEIRKRGN